jgi:hypothetical protein
MTYQQTDATSDGETRRCSSEELTDHGFAVYEHKALQARVAGDGEQDAADRFLAAAARA